MSVVVTPRGTRGVKMPPMPRGVMRLVNSLMFRFFKNRPFQNAQVLQLTTVGARTGQQRQSTLAYFREPDQSVLIVASAGGTANHPAWFFNLARNPDKVWARIGDQHVKVSPSTLTGPERERAWTRITTQSPGFASYEDKTDRELPIIRLTPSAA